MAISTYSELLTATANWLGRADLTSRIPEFIALFEAKFNREARVPQQERRNPAFSIASEYETVPTDFIELRSIHLTTDPKRPMSSMPPDQEVMFYNSGSGIPLFVSVTGHTATDGTLSLRFAPVPDGSYTAVLTYYAKLPGLNATTQTTNWLLTNHPDLYLYGVLLEAAAFVENDSRVSLWKSAYDMAIGGLRNSTNRARWGAGGMAARAV